MPRSIRLLLLTAWCACVGSTRAAELRMAFGEAIPPFCIPSADAGIEVDVFREALALRGHSLRPVYLPFARVPLAFKQGEVDATMTDLGEDLSRYGGHYGDTAVVYDNVFITLSRRGLRIRTPADLQDLSVVSFQGAGKRYPDWLDGVKRAKRYREINDQFRQVRMLMIGHVDVVLSDRSIFKYFSLQLRRQGIEVLPIDEHPFTTPKALDYRPVFRSPALRDDFNAGLRQLRSSGRMKAIYDKYLLEPLASSASRPGL